MSAGRPGPRGIPVRIPCPGGILPLENNTVKAPRNLLFLIPILTGAPLPAPAQQPEPPEVQSGSAYVTGSVVDHATGQPLSGAQVTLREADGQRASMQLTGERGSFRFGSIHPQGYELRIVYLGFKEVRLVVRPRHGDDVQVEVEMVREVVALEPLVVTATRQSLLRRVGFLDRRETGLGRFLTRSDIEARNPFEVSDLFRSMPGFRVVPAGRGSGNLVVGRGSCPPAMFLDGARLLEGTSIDEVLRPETLEAIEVYHASQAPAQFQANRCGAVVAWSRDPGRQTGGNPFTWRRLLFSLGFLTLAFTATR